MRFPDTGLQCVVYIGRRLPVDPTKPTGPKKFTPLGTGFLVSHLRGNATVPIYYLVTAHHVIRRLNPQNNFAIRINDNSGHNRVFLSGQKFNWWRHPDDDSVDAVVFPWGMTQPTQYKLFPTARFVTEQNLPRNMIGVGDEAYMVGLFRPWQGANRIHPMVRTGHIAMMAAERMNLGSYYGPAYYHLLDMFSLKGFSGSPIFVHETVSTPIDRQYPDDSPYLNGVGNLFLLGLVHGIMPVKVMEELTGVKDSDQRWHSGITTVVPSTQILEILNQPALIAYEQRMEKMLEEAESAIDSEGIEHDEIKEPRQRTRAGLDIGVPKKADILRDLKRASRKKTP